MAAANLEVVCQSRSDGALPPFVFAFSSILLASLFASLLVALMVTSSDVAIAYLVHLVSIGVPL